MLKKRVITGFVLFGMLLIILWAEGTIHWFAIAAAVIAMLGLWELYGMVSTCGKGKPAVWLGMLLTMLFIFQPLFPWENDIGILLTASVVLPLLWVMLRKDRENACSSWAFTLAGIIYLGWLASRYVALMEIEPDGRGWVILALFCTFACDTMAFFVGHALGRHKMAPGISPNKTWEGAAGGLAGSIGIGLLVAWIFELPLGVWQAIALSTVISLFAQTGDLVESLFKRNMGTKDSGQALPGHGGVLDRIDGVVFAGLVVYYYVIWLA
jgi:phosphatidate cytidylyltransferase